MIMCLTAASGNALNADSAIRIDGSKSGMSPGVMRSSREILRGIEDLPVIKGFVMTTVKDNPLVEVADLRRGYERVVLLRAEAAWLLKERGHDVSDLLDSE